MTFKDVKNALLEEEAYRNLHKEQEATALSAKEKRTCERCGENGHNLHLCRAPEGYKKCYECKKLVNDHVARNCPELHREYRERYDNKYERREPYCKGRNDRREEYKRDNRDNRDSYNRENRFRKNNNRWYRDDKPYKQHQKRMKKVSLYKNKKTGQMFVRLADKREEDYEQVVFYKSDSEGREYYAHSESSENSNIGKCFLTCSNIIRFVADSGASDHLVKSVNCLSKQQELEVHKRISCANRDADLVIKKKGEVRVFAEDDQPYTINDAYCSEELAQNLLSLGKICDEDFTVQLTKSETIVLDPIKNKVILHRNREGGLRWLNLKLRNKRKRTSGPLVAVEEAENENGGSIEKKLTKIPRLNFEHDYSESHCSKSNVIVDNHNFANTNPNPKCIGVPNEQIENEVQFLEYLVEGAEMSIEELKELEKQSITNLRDQVGILWHKRLGHVSKSYLEKTAKTIPNLKGVVFPNEILDCRACIMAKMTKLPCKQTRKRAEIPLHTVHTDMMGPVEPASYRGNKKYIVTFIDDYSRYANCYIIVDKTDVHKGLSEYLKDLRVMLGIEPKIIVLRTDNGTEYKTQKMTELVEKLNITFEFAEPRTPEHNGVAERFNREIQEKARALMFDSGFPFRFWDFAVGFAVHTYNRTPHKPINFQTPFEKLRKQVPELKYIKRFECLAFVLEQNTVGKWVPRARHSFLLGCTPTGYVLLEPETGNIVKAKHVKCFESKVFGNFPKLVSLVRFSSPPVTPNSWFDFEGERNAIIVQNKTQECEKGDMNTLPSEILRKGLPEDVYGEKQNEEVIDNPSSTIEPESELDVQNEVYDVEIENEEQYD